MDTVTLARRSSTASLTPSWNNIPINQSDLRDKFTVYVKFRLATRVRCFYICAIHHFSLILGISYG